MKSLSRRPVYVAMYSLVVTVACEKSPSVVDPAQTPVSAGQVGTPAPLQPIRGTDDMLSFLAERVPGGFGGLYLDEDRKLVVLLKDPSRASDAFSALVALQRAVERRPLLTTSDFRVAQADYDFRELREWRDAGRDLLTLDGVSSLDINERQNRVLVGISSAGAESNVRQQAEAFGIPADALVVELEQVALASHTLQKQDPNPPLEGGYEISMSSGLCTLGVNVVDTMSTEYEHGFLTASHCTPTMGEVDSVEISQPFAGPRIGIEIIDPPYTSLVFCPSGHVCRLSDAAIARYDDPADSHLGYIERAYWYGVTVNHSLSQWEIFSEDSGCQFFDDCSLDGMEIHKVGKTTGWTSGIVDRTCAAVNVRDNFTIICVDRANGPSNTVDKGDSGAAAWERGTSTSSWVRLHGIVFAKDNKDKFWFARIHNVRTELGDFGTLAVSGGPQ